MARNREPGTQLAARGAGTAAAHTILGVEVRGVASSELAVPRKLATDLLVCARVDERINHVEQLLKNFLTKPLLERRQALVLSQKSPDQHPRRLLHILNATCSFLQLVLRQR